MSIGIFLVGLLVLTLGIVFVIYRKAREQKGGSALIPVLVMGLGLIVFSQSFAIVPTGQTGVRSSFGQISQNVVKPGFNWKVPLVEQVDLVNNKQQDQSIANSGEKIWCESAGKIPLFVEGVTVTYQINPEKSAWIFANVTNYQDNLISYGLVSSAIKSCTVSLSIEEVTNRTRIEGLTAEALQAAVDKKFDAGTILIIRVVIGNMDFEESYNDTIISKNKAVQAAEEQAIKNTQAVDKADADAKVLLTQAQAEADAILIKAKAEAEANEILSASLNSLILANNWIIKWNGAQPYVLGADGQIIDISALIKQGDLPQPTVAPAE